MLESPYGRTRGVRRGCCRLFALIEAKIDVDHRLRLDVLRELADNVARVVLADEELRVAVLRIEDRAWRADLESAAEFGRRLPHLHELEDQRKLNDKLEDHAPSA